MNFKEKYIGDRRFYRNLFVLVLPMIIQQAITNFVSLLDNVMVGGLGTVEMSSVSIVNQLIFVFNLALFGGLAGASIFGTQFYGHGNWTGMRDTFRFKMYFVIATTAVAIAIFVAFDEELIRLFLNPKTNSAETINIAVKYGKSYLQVMLFGLLPFAIVQAYSGTLRETGETVAPMIAGFVAIVINVTFNTFLIFGLCGFPKLGVAGAAIATVMSRWVEMIIVVIYTHVKHSRFKFIEGAYKSLRVPMELVKKITIMGTPLLINEVAWSIGQTFINQSYAQRGLDVVAAANITTTAWNLFCVIMFAMGTAVSILVGRKLGTGDREGAIDTARKLMFATFAMHVVIMLLIIAAAPFIPELYNTEADIKKLATQLLIMAGLALPMHSIIHCIYFTIRSGGKTVITLLFDSVFTWVVPVVLSFVLCRYTDWNIVLIYAIVHFSEVIKLAIGLPMLKSGFWANCLVEGE